MHRNHSGAEPLLGGNGGATDIIAGAEQVNQEILRANASVKTAADLVTKYRKNVQYNLEATKGSDGKA